MFGFDARHYSFAYNIAFCVLWTARVITKLTLNPRPNSVEEYNRLKELVGGTAASNVHCVAGEYDLQSETPNANEALSGGMPSFPETKVIQLGSFRVGIIGGHQVAPYGDLRALSMVRKRLGVDVLVCGWRRKNGVVEFDGGYYIFPVR